MPISDQIARANMIVHQVGMEYVLHKWVFTSQYYSLKLNLKKFAEVRIECMSSFVSGLFTGAVSFYGSDIPIRSHNHDSCLSLT